jgi:hypothetical protein
VTAASRGLLPEQLDGLLASEEALDGSVQYRDQAARLEEAMVVQRRWELSEFQGRIAGHPLLGRIARRLVWVVDGRTVRLDGLGELVDHVGAPAGDGEWVARASGGRRFRAVAGVAGAAGGGAAVYPG